MAFSLAEAALLLGVSYTSAYRLSRRGFLKSSKALRRKVIPKAEIERFLAETQ